MSQKLVRESHILDRLALTKELSVAELSKDLGVSEVTIRSNLRDLEHRGLLARTHGGAQASSYQTVLERERDHAEEKSRIALAAAALVRDNDTLMVEGGTTTVMLMRSLGGRQGVQVVTNSTLAIPAARLNPEFRLVVSGGLFHHESESMVGADAIRTIRKFNARVAFVGTDGFTAERGLTTTFGEGAEVIRAMHERAEETWLLADSSKYGRAGFVGVLPLSELRGVITDAGIGRAGVLALEERGIRVIVA